MYPAGHQQVHQERVAIMGMIRIEVAGSFLPNCTRSFSAMEHGHADAVAQAIEWLSSNVLPRAIRRDHDLQEKGGKPFGPFGHDIKTEEAA